MASKSNMDREPVIGISIDRTVSTDHTHPPMSHTSPMDDDTTAGYELSQATTKEDPLVSEPPLSNHESPPTRTSASLPPPDIYIDPSNSDNPRSAFYAHRSTRTDEEQARADSRTKLPLYGESNDSDTKFKPTHSNNASRENFNTSKSSLNKAISQTKSQQSNHKHSRTVSGKLRGTSIVITDLERNSVWPSRQELEEKALLAKRRKLQRTLVGRQWSKLSNKQKFWTKVVIALFVVAAAIGIGVGISIAVRGGYYTSDGQSKTIPDPDQPDR